MKEIKTRPIFKTVFAVGGDDEGSVDACITDCLLTSVVTDLKGRLCFHKRLSVHRRGEGRVSLVPMSFVGGRVSLVLCHFWEEG